MGEIQACENLESLAGFPERDAAALAAAELITVGDLLNWFPRRYEDRRQFDAYPAQSGGGAVCLRGLVIDSVKRRMGGKRSFYEIMVQEQGGNVLATNKITCRWFNMPFMHRMVAVGHEVILYGKPKDSSGRLIMDHPEFEVVKEGEQQSIHLERIVPIYRNVTGIPQRRLRETIHRMLENLDETSVAASYDLEPGKGRKESLDAVHFPASLEAAAEARRSFALEEFFLLQLKVLWRRKLFIEHAGRSQGQRTGMLKAFYESLPFDLTGAQKRSVKEIAVDMRAGRPMHRLLQGDVGSGKTFVAICAMLLAIESGAQAALMAPTQILAEQHFLTFRKWLSPLGVRISLVTGAKQESAHLEMEGEAQIVIGTHALIYDNVAFSDLGLIVIDEQHKFGVSQRGRLIRQGIMPDVLVMTATPIPRTLTLTIYGDLDVSVLDELPAGRGKIVTAVRVKPKVSDVTRFLKEQLEAGRQAYLVYPLVEESASVKALAATTEFPKWVKRLGKFEVGLLHGKMPPDEKDAMMEKFRTNQVQALVATTVVEVGVDVANANVMVVHNAERFGLAQLHQLRGRIGRGEFKSYCILLTDGKSEEGNEKLAVLEATRDGFLIAEEDLRLRGPGEVLGTAQSGIGTLRFVEYLADTSLIREARTLAEGLLEKDPQLEGVPALRAMMQSGEGNDAGLSGA
jgi:ATP-dependent DNA helicase RecG